MSNWKTVRLGEVCDVKGGKRLPKGVNLLSTPTPHPYIRVRDLNNKKTIELSDDFEFVDAETQKTISRYIVKANDIIISIVGTIGLIGKIGSTLDNANLTENCVKLINLKGINSDFLYYYLISIIGQSEIAKGTVGAVQAKLPIKNIQDISISLPSPEEQRRIEGILRTLDDKIECNNRINRNLEEQAAALFRSWFVDFEFPYKNFQPYRTAGGKMIPSPLGDIPKGWQIGRLDDLISIKYGKDHKKLNSGTIPVYGSGGIMRYANASLYTKESVLIPRKGTLNNVFYINTPFWSVDTMFYSEMKIQGIAKFIYFFLKSKNLASMNAGSAVPSMTTEILNQLSLIIPNKSVFLSFDNLISPMFAAIQNNNKENQTLATLRDTLLPKLINNEITI